VERDVGGAGETDWNTKTAAAIGVTGIMDCPGSWLFLGWYDSQNGWFRDSLRWPPKPGLSLVFTRLWADRRTGTDRRAEPRRQSVGVVGEEAERRTVVDRRRGAERRSTLDRRGRQSRAPNAERPVEHVRNALQLLREVALVGELSPGSSEDLGAAIDRLNRAVGLLERPKT